MRHNKKINHLGRTSSHRQAMLANMATSLIKHKRIYTTTAKAKALRKYVEPLLTKSKDDTTHSRRVVFALLQDKKAVTELFTKISEKVENRPGGYTRIIKTGNRLGDNAAMCFIELVDYNENMLKDRKKAVGKTRRSRKKATVSTAEIVSKAAVEDTKSKDPDIVAVPKAVEIEKEVVTSSPEAVETVEEAVEAVEAAVEDVEEAVDAVPEESVHDSLPESPEFSANPTPAEEPDTSE